jgi:hypothetical protein
MYLAGFGKRLTREHMERILRDAGVDPKHCTDVAELSRLMGFDALCDALFAARARAEKSVMRALLRKHARGPLEG